jgi:hypothetical protein
MLYVFFRVIPRHLNFICRRFGTLRLFHLRRQVGVEWLNLKIVGVSIWEKVWLSLFLSQPFSRIDIPTILKFSHSTPTFLWRWNRQSVLKCQHIKFRRQGITQKKTYNFTVCVKLQIKSAYKLIYNLSQWPTRCTNFQYIYYNPVHVHVSSNILLILRRLNCIKTASGIVTLFLTINTTLPYYAICHN